MPDVLIQPHSAPLQGAFYDGAMFPPEFRGSLFVALHGSWNRSNRTGYKVVRAIFKDGKPTGSYEDFVTGFLQSDQEVWGRPVGVAVDRTGALLLGEDGNSTIWRVTRP
jgi:glucose/arabinose dehydrogenase